MNLIYHNAFFTVVAAAGEDSSYGLPGVSTISRKAQTWEEFDGRLLVSSVRPFLPDRENNRWSTRAWTYQEGVFSTRRFIFNCHQVTFECRMGAECELFTQGALVSDRDTPYTGVRSRSIWSHIEMYSSRRLTYEADTLNAITATLNAFNNNSMQGPVRSIWGNPLAQDMAALDSIPPGRLKGAIFTSEHAIFGYSLAWTGLDTHLNTGHPPSLRRRTGFPTWSWTSCADPIRFITSDDDFEKVLPDPGVMASVETIDNQVINLSDYLKLSRPPEPSPYIHIEGLSVCGGLSFTTSEGLAVIDVDDDKYQLEAHINLDTLPDGMDEAALLGALQEKGPGTRWQTLVVWALTVSDPWTKDKGMKPYIILLLRVNDRHHPEFKVFERVGNLFDLHVSRRSSNPGILDREEYSAAIGLLSRIQLAKENLIIR